MSIYVCFHYALGNFSWTSHYNFMQLLLQLLEQFAEFCSVEFSGGLGLCPQTPVFTVNVICLSYVLENKSFLDVHDSADNIKMDCDCCKTWYHFYVLKRMEEK